MIKLLLIFSVAFLIPISSLADTSNLPDLIVPNITIIPGPVDNTYHVGDSIFWSVTVVNIGLGTASESFVGHYLGASTNDLSNRINLDKINPLEYGEEVEGWHSYVFTGSDIGQRFLICELDHYRGIEETNEINNTGFSEPFNIIARIDFSGTVTGIGAGGMGISVYDWATGVWLGNSMVNSDGSYVVTGLAQAVSGQYRVFLYSNDTYYFGEEYASPVFPGADNINFSPVEGGKIYGVVSGNSQGLNIDVDVMLPNCGSPIIGYSPVDQGNYSILVPVGEYYVFAHSLEGTDNGIFLSEYWTNAGGTSDCNEAETVSVTFGLDTPIDFSLELDGSISGTVYESDGITPIGSGQITIYNMDQISIDNTNINPGGTYEVDQLAPGDYVIQVNPSTNHISEYYDDASSFYGATVITAQEGERIAGIDFSLDRGENLPPDDFHLLFPDTSGDPVFDISGVITLGWQPTTDPDGDALTYTVDIVNDPSDPEWGSQVFSFTIEHLTNAMVSIGPEASFIQNRRYLWQVSAVDEYGATTVSIETNWTFEIRGDISINGWISGGVFDLNGSAIADANVSVQGFDVEMLTDNNGGATGYFMGTGHPGDYQLIANAAGYETNNRQVTLFNGGFSNGDIFLFELTPQHVLDPSFTPATGTYIPALEITITCATPGANIYYTKDGSDPDEESTLYEGAFDLIGNGDFTLKAKAYVDSWLPSNIVTIDYTLIPDPGDLNGNGQIGIDDVQVLSDGFGKADSPNNADADNDGDVDGLDIIELIDAMNAL
ncbi:MAG: hypothetical protein GY699_05220 [Desulfobacteraceae bacterium]|nr:hypothetical protein [Desulfobacteraceae bacterium]